MNKAQNEIDSLLQQGYKDLHEEEEKKKQSLSVNLLLFIFFFILGFSAPVIAIIVLISQ